MNEAEKQAEQLLPCRCGEAGGYHYSLCPSQYRPAVAQALRDAHSWHVQIGLRDKKIDVLQAEIAKLKARLGELEKMWDWLEE